jgi:hypothetical protein
MDNSVSFEIDSCLGTFKKVDSCLGTSKKSSSPLVKVHLDVKNVPSKLKAYTTSKENHRD